MSIRREHINDLNGKTIKAIKTENFCIENIKFKINIQQIGLSVNYKM